MNIEQSRRSASPSRVMRTLKATMLCLALLQAAMVLTRAQAEEQGPSKMLRMLGMLDGNCVAKLQGVKFECGGRVSWMLLANGRAVITFFSADDKFSFNLAGGGDRQPALNDYYQKIDTVRIMKGEKITYENKRAKGECYFRVSDDGRTVQKLKCEVSEKSRNHVIGLEPVSKTNITTY